MAVAKHKRPAPHTLSPQRPSGPPLCKRGGHAGGRGWRGSGCGNLSTRTFTNLLDPQRHPSVPRTHYLPSTKGTKPRPETPIPPCSHSVALGYSACSAGAQAGPAVQSQGWVGLALALAARVVLHGCLGRSRLLPLCLLGECFFGRGGVLGVLGSLNSGWCNGYVQQFVFPEQRATLPPGTCSLSARAAPSATRRLCARASARRVPFPSSPGTPWFWPVSYGTCYLRAGSDPLHQPALS